ncbi:HAD-IIB family hydrolase [Microbacterium sp. GCS4]|uniref:HAD-IIB family hydrolase n=1 Tax=Microbacterium sp. GCS4 TaxID=1692239 RepID=UPI000683152B|nr:HAD-IIB family hydrolase [Microbacterium sp. GCS4]KNY04136.1 HAD family hydrolase [Microbacterium sp. GCS4]
MASPLRLVAFDLDDTLAPSKSAIDPTIGRLLIALADHVDVAIISGGRLEQFTAQVIDRLPAASASTLERFHLLPACGTQYYRIRDARIETVYARRLTADQRERTIAAFESEARGLGLWERETWGDILEDRGSQITYSALGQEAPIDAKTAWDPDGAKKASLRAAVAARLPDLDVRSGGSTSIDVTERGVDKAFGMRELSRSTGIALDEMLFIGDRLDPEGNDYPVLALGVPCHAVTGWEDTAAYLDALLSTWTAAARTDA